MRRLTAAALVAALAFLGACAPGRPDTSAAESAEIPVRSWLPADGPPEIVVVAVHGFNDYSQAFAGFGQYAAEHGVAVYAYDQPGFGANPDAGYWAGIEVMAGRLKTEVQSLRERHPGVPVHVLGESMGGALAIVAATGADPLEADGLILSAPAVWGGDQFSPFYRAALWTAVRLLPELRLTGKGLDVQASDNIDMLRALGADPLVIKGTRVAAIDGLVRLMDRAFARAPQLDGPMLVLRGARDEIVPPQAVSAMLDRLRARDCTEVYYAEGWHMLLRDLQRVTVWADILAWLRGERPPSYLDRACGAELIQDAAWSS